jgi:hypothetical protein
MFSKGTAFYQRTFALRLVSNVAASRQAPNVLVAGGAVGRASSVELDPDGRNVTIYLRIFQKYQIYATRGLRSRLPDFWATDHRHLPGASRAALATTPLFNAARVQRAGSRGAGNGNAFHIGQATTNERRSQRVRRYALTPETLTNLAGTVNRLALLSGCRRCDQQSRLADWRERRAPHECCEQLESVLGPVVPDRRARERSPFQQRGDDYAGDQEH